MKFIKTTSIAIMLATVLSSCGPVKLEELDSFIKNTKTYLESIDIVSSNTKTESDLNSIKLKRDPLRLTDESVVRYFLLKYKSVVVTYDIKTPTETIENAKFEVRGEVFLSVIRENRISITSSMPVLNYLFISTDQLEAMEVLNDEFKASDDYLISPFLTKYKYGVGSNSGFAFDLNDFSSTGGGLVTSQTRVDFSYSNEDNRLEKWQFTSWNKIEQTGGTEAVDRTIEITFDWELRED